MFERIAVIKTGWSEAYRNSQVTGDYSYAFPDHEKVNFLPDPQGNYLVHVPRTGGNAQLGIAGSPPSPKNLDGWLIFAIAKKPGEAGLRLVGWYEDATFLGEYRERPEYAAGTAWFGPGQDGGNVTYTISAPRGVLIDAPNRPGPFSGTHLSRHWAYLRGEGKSGDWREPTAKMLLEYRAKHLSKMGVADGPTCVSPDDSDGHKSGGPNGGGRGGICADPERRKEVEQAAIAMVKAAYPAPAYEIEDRQKHNCGYDLLIRATKDRKLELHIEVKGTQNPEPHFLMSRREYAYMLEHPGHWRLAMVTSALSKTPSLTIMDADEVQRRFFWEVFAWHATQRP